MTKSKKVSSNVKRVSISPVVSTAMKSILSAVTKKPKFYTRATIVNALKSVDPKVVRKARHELWEAKKIRKANGKYIPFVAKKASK